MSQSPHRGDRTLSCPRVSGGRENRAKLDRIIFVVCLQKGVDLDQELFFPIEPKEAEDEDEAGQDGALTIEADESDDMESPSILVDVKPASPNVFGDSTGVDGPSQAVRFCLKIQNPPFSMRRLLTGRSIQHSPSM
jgi:hypothetical protein